MIKIHNKTINAKIESMGGVIEYGPSDGILKIRLVRVIDKNGKLFHATSWGRLSKSLKLGDDVIITKTLSPYQSKSFKNYTVLRKGQ